MGTCRVHVTVCNVLATITREVLATFFSKYGQVEESNLLRSAAGTAYGDHVFQLFEKGGIPRHPRSYHQQREADDSGGGGTTSTLLELQAVGAYTKILPQEGPPKAAASTASTTTTTTATITTATISSKTSIPTAKESGQVQPKKAEEGWTEVTRKKRKSKTSTVIASPAKSTSPQYIPTSVMVPIPPNIIKHPALPETKAPSKKKPKAKTVLITTEALDPPMETTTNLKRRRNSGEGATKKMCAWPPCTDDPLEGPSNAFQPTPQQPPPQQTLPQTPIPFPPPPFPPPPLPPLPPP